MRVICASNTKDPMQVVNQSFSVKLKQYYNPLIICSCTCIKTLLKCVTLLNYWSNQNMINLMKPLFLNLTFYTSIYSFSFSVCSQTCFKKIKIHMTSHILQVGKTIVTIYLSFCLLALQRFKKLKIFTFQFRRILWSVFRPDQRRIVVFGILIKRNSD